MLGDAPPARPELVGPASAAAPGEPVPVVAGARPVRQPGRSVSIMPGTSGANLTLGALTSSAFQGSDGYLYFTDLDGSVHSTFLPMSPCCGPVLVCLGPVVAIVVHLLGSGLWVTDGKGRAERLPGDEEHTGGAVGSSP